MTQPVTSPMPQSVELKVVPRASHQRVLTPEALAFVAELERRFGERRRQLLQARREVQARIDKGDLYDFLPETKEIRHSKWTVAKLPKDLLDRRVEITGPTDPKMVINALNSGANVFMADFEDANCPTFDNVIEGQLSMMGAVRRELTFDSSEKHYRLNEKIATLFVRPRGWHLPEAHVLVDGQPMSGSLFDFGLFFFHNAKEQLRRGTGPYFYLPKMEHHLEARLWNDVFVFAQQKLGIPNGTIKATVLIETLPASFQMDEILWELRDHSAGLNCGRWDYIFSYIKKLASHEGYVLPDRGQVTMDKGFLNAYSQLLIQTCHKREVHAMGGMAAFIPIKNDAHANEAALSKVRADKLREVKNGHDGTWVAHPGLVQLAKSIFDENMKGPNQIERKREDVKVTRDELLKVPEGGHTEAGLRQNVRVGIQYIEAWLRGIGCVPLYNLMEDAATAEISRAQVWQQLRYGVSLDPIGKLTKESFHRIVDEELTRILSEVGPSRFEAGKFKEARELFERLSTAPTFEEFLTLPAYQAVVKAGG